MTDCEMLEMAATAAGIDWFDEPAAKQGRGLHLKSGRFWNPITDDGDALRLAVKLGLLVSIQHEELLGNVEVHISPSGRPQGKFVAEPLGTDHYAATRRAIVRAAAEIGRSMT